MWHQVSGYKVLLQPIKWTIAKRFVKDIGAYDKVIYNNWTYKDNKRVSCITLYLLCSLNYPVHTCVIHDSSSCSAFTPGCAAGSAVHTSCPALCTSEPPPVPGLQWAAAPDTTASWEPPCCWWGRLQVAGTGPDLRSPPEPSRSTAPASVQPRASDKTEQRPSVSWTLSNTIVSSLRSISLRSNWLIYCIRCPEADFGIGTVS